MATRGLTWTVALRLGRVSNVPTVWSNVLTGAVLADAAPSAPAIAALALGTSLLYIAGMFLNDAFDHAIDARERPERPIPSGFVSVSEVFVAGGTLMVVGYAIVLCASAFGAPGSLAGAALSGALLIGAIVLYNAWHKANALGPLIMGACRVLVYVMAAFAIAPPGASRLALPSIVLLVYLIGLTTIAKQEKRAAIATAGPVAMLALPSAYGIYAALTGAGAIAFLAVALLAGWTAYALSFVLVRSRFAPGRGVVSLIAGISLLDAVIVAAHGRFDLAICAIGCWALTTYLQRYVAGT